MATVLSLHPADTAPVLDAADTVENYLALYPSSALRAVFAPIKASIERSLGDEEPLPSPTPERSRPRSGANLFSAAQANASSGWTLLNGATYDAGVSRLLGGSINLSAEATPPVASSNANAKSPLIAVSPNSKYTFSGYIKSTEPGAQILVVVSRYDGSNGFLRNAGGSRHGAKDSIYSSVSGGVWTVQYVRKRDASGAIVLDFTGSGATRDAALDELLATVGASDILDSDLSRIETEIADYRAKSDATAEWFEFVTLIKTASDERQLRITLQRATEDAAVGGTLRAADFYLGAGWGFSETPLTKRAFNGSKTKIDSFGNYSVRRGDSFESFFPFGIFQDNAEDFATYSEQGFNLIMSNQGTSSAFPDRAQAATSAFNPYGMMSMVELARFFQTADPAYNNLDTLDTVLAASNHPAVFGYYWDNEQYNEISVPKSLLRILRKSDPDHPVYALFGNEGLVRIFDDCVDSVGDYEWRENGSGILTQKYQDGSRIPQGISIISLDDNTTSGYLRLAVYRSIIYGARGVALYRDLIFGTGTKIATLPFWNTIPTLRSEIDALMPIIRRPHWTAWDATPSTDSVLVGTRDYRGEGIVIVANSTASALTVDITIANLPYSTLSAKNFLTGSTANVVNSVLTLSLGANETRVYRLVS